MTREHIPQQVEAIAAALSPNVERILYSFRDDWQGIESLFFRVVFSDELDRPGRLRELQNVQCLLQEALADLGMPLFFNFRTASECARMKDPEWRAA
jgi:hypothetical protein